MEGTGTGTGTAPISPTPTCTSTPQGVAMLGLLLLLVNKYPRVRRHSSEQLYIQLLTLDSSQLMLTDSSATGVMREGDLDKVQEVLISTAWDGDVDASDGARAARDEIARVLNLTVPAARSQGEGARAKKAQDENASYGTLLQDFERGV